MKSKNTKKKNSIAVLRHLGEHVRYLRSIKADSMLIRDMEILVSVLKNPLVQNLFTEMHTDIPLQPTLPILRTDYTALSLDEIEELINNESTSKTVFAAIASKRFSLTTGELSKSSKKMLQATLQNLVDNERTHLAISRLAGGREDAK